MSSYITTSPVLFYSSIGLAFLLTCFITMVFRRWGLTLLAPLLLFFAYLASQGGLVMGVGLLGYWFIAILAFIVVLAHAKASRSATLVLVGIGYLALLSIAPFADVLISSIYMHIQCRQIENHIPRPIENVSGVYVDGNLGLDMHHLLRGSDRAGFDFIEYLDPERGLRRYGIDPVEGKYKSTSIDSPSSRYIVGWFGTQSRLEGHLGIWRMRLAVRERLTGRQVADINGYWNLGGWLSKHSDPERNEHTFPGDVTGVCPEEIQRRNAERLVVERILIPSTRQ